MFDPVDPFNLSDSSKRRFRIRKPTPYSGRLVSLDTASLSVLLLVQIKCMEDVDERMKPMIAQAPPVVQREYLEDTRRWKVELIQPFLTLWLTIAYLEVKYS